MKQFLVNTKQLGCQRTAFDEFIIRSKMDRKKVRINPRNFIKYLSLMKDESPHILGVNIARHVNRESRKVFNDGCALNDDIFSAIEDGKLKGEDAIMGCIFALQAQGAM